METTNQFRNYQYLNASLKYLRVAGRWRFGQIVFVVIIPTALAIFGGFHKAQIFLPAFFGFTSVVCDVTLFNVMIRNARFKAAQLACFYDAQLLNSAPARAFATHCPADELVRIAAVQTSRRSGALTRAEAWHYERIAAVASPIADLLYLRTNFVRDEDIRALYRDMLFVAVFVLIVILVVSSALFGIDIKVFFSNVLFPIVPLAAWLGREIFDHIYAAESSRRIQCVMDGGHGLISEHIGAGQDTDLFRRERDSLHGMLFMFRCVHPEIPNWLHFYQSDGRRETMISVLDDYINDAVSAGLGIVAPDPGARFTQR